MKNNQWQKTTTQTPADKVKVIVTVEKEKTKTQAKTQTNSIIGRRYSIDDNGGGYLGL
jgi:hypothetical protein